MTKDESVVRYLDLASMEENIPYDMSHFLTELDITDEDICVYQHKRESELSLKPMEKRNIIVKHVIKPLLKKHGFSASGLDWHCELDDSYIIIHMMNSQLNSIRTGACFRFHISVVKKGEIVDKLSNQWAYNQFCDLRQFHFLPHYGMLSPYYSGDMYKIDGYKNYLPSDSPVKIYVGK